ERRGQGGSFADPRRVDFVRRLMKEGPPLLCSTMTVNGQLVSYRFGPIDGTAYYDWNTGTDPAMARYTPGLVLLDAIVERLSMSERVRTVDFLRGDEDYK